jgi:cell wall-associated NlpC family hydrolase
MSYSHYIGIPYKATGRTIEGSDCWGLVCMVARDIFKVDMPSYNEYSPDEDWQEMSDVIQRHIKEWDTVTAGDEVAGDVVLMRLRGQPLHVGIVIGNNRMIHIMKGINSVMEDYTGRVWNKRVLGIYRYING